MKKNLCFLLLFKCLFFSATAQYATLYPSNWFTGMKWNKVQLLVHGNYDGFNTEKVQVRYPGVQVQKITPLENGRYMAIDLLITPAAKPGMVTFQFNNGGKNNTVQWPLKAKREPS